MSQSAESQSDMPHPNAIPSKRFRGGALASLAGVALCGFFVAKIPVRPELAAVSAAFVLVFAYPSYSAVVRNLGWKRGTLGLALLGLYALILETVAVKTGLPYGRFSYGPKIGTLLFDAVPWTVPFSWTPLVLWARALGGKYAVSGVATLLLCADFVLDPGAVAQEFWRYDAGGLYYDVPLSNFFGWVLSGSIGAWLANKVLGPAQAGLPTALSGLLSLTFWTSVCLWMGLWIPGCIGILLVGGTLWRTNKSFS